MQKVFLILDFLDSVILGMKSQGHVCGTCMVN